jgi:hypothetical protein
MIAAEAEVARALDIASTLRFSFRVTTVVVFVMAPRPLSPHAPLGQAPLPTPEISSAVDRLGSKLGVMLGGGRGTKELPTCGLPAPRQPRSQIGVQFSREGRQRGGHAAPAQRRIAGSTKSTTKVDRDGRRRLRLKAGAYPATCFARAAISAAAHHGAESCLSGHAMTAMAPIADRLLHCSEWTDGPKPASRGAKMLRPWWSRRLRDDGDWRCGPVSIQTPIAIGCLTSLLQGITHATAGVHWWGGDMATDGGPKRQGA